ncbi:MAG: hypothetical protein WDN46_12310 [Methylocella sp.]
MLGYTVPLSGYTPPPGFYYSNTFYLYSGSASANVTFPLGRVAGAGLTYQFAVNISQAVWITEMQALGGSIGFAALIPFGSETTHASLEFTGPLGINRN